MDSLFCRFRRRPLPFGDFLKTRHEVGGFAKGKNYLTGVAHLYYMCYIPMETSRSRAKAADGNASHQSTWKLSRPGN